MHPARGQALVFVLALMAALLGAFFLVFSSGQIVSDKLRLTNTADAAAYSAALWEARSLNFQTYMNRAIVANESAVAQLVSLRSWSGYMDRTLRNVSLVTSIIPYVNAAVRALSRGWDRVDAVLQASLPLAEGAISRWNVDALELAQTLAHQQAVITAGELAAEVVAVNQPRAELSAASRLFAVRNFTGWQQRLTTKYRHGDPAMSRLRALVMASRDGFTSERNWDPFDTAILDIRKRGGTDLVGDYVWRAMDTMSIHVDLGIDEEEVPVGWNAAENRRLPDRRRGVHGGSFRSNPRASRRAELALRPASLYRGLPEMRDIWQPERQQDLTLRYVVDVRKDAAAIGTADVALEGAAGVLPDGTRVDAAPNLADGALHATSAAEVYFRRPFPRSDGRREYPSLFNPAWQARLVSVSELERSLAAPARALTVDPYAAILP